MRRYQEEKEGERGEMVPVKSRNRRAERGKRDGELSEKKGEERREKGGGIMREGETEGE